MATTPTLPDTRTPAAPAAGDELARGALFGRYVIVDVIGEGGMGKVFAAYDPTLDRNVALKIVCDAPTRDSQARLAREAKAMARVQHPAIVAVHDVGSVGARVFIAMELVRGETLLAWRERDKRTWREIVAKYVAAGRGLQAAHAAGVVHRDFKPENVLVDAAGRVRVTDFGLSNILASDERGAPSSAGTPWYMAPEQYLHRGADARSDQFSFCVALWLAVYGDHPFAQVESELVENVKAGRLRAASDGGPRWLAKVLRRGLALDPAARHPDMASLLAALERGLARRRRSVLVPVAFVVLGSATAIAVASTRHAGPSCDVAGAAASASWSPPQRARVASALGKLDPAVAAHVLGVLDRYAHAWAAQRVDACRATNERGEQSGELLDLRMQCLDRRLAELDALVDVLATGEPGVVAAAPTAVDALVPLDACADATALREVVPLPVSPPARVRVVAARQGTSRVKADLDTGRYAHGRATLEPLGREAHALGYAPLVAETELLRGMLARRTDRFDEAEDALYQAIASAELGRDGDIAVRGWFALLHFVAEEQRKPKDAFKLAKIARGTIERYTTNPDVAAGLAENLGVIALDLGKLDDAEPHLQRAYELRRAQFGEDDPEVAASLQHLAMLATERGDHATAIDRHRRSLVIFEKTRGPDHPDTLIEVNDYAAALFMAERLDDALALYRRGLAATERTLGSDGVDAAEYYHNIALVLTERGEHADAIALQRRALAIFVRVHGEHAPDTAIQRLDLARALRAGGQHAEAIAAFRDAIAAAEQALGHDAPETQQARDGLAKLEAPAR